MREIASFPDERAAKLFADVLCARSIDTEVSRSRDGGYVVWVLEEKHVEVSRAAWAAFDANPEAPEHVASAGCVDRKSRLTEVEQRRSRHEVIVNVRGRWTNATGERPILTLALIVLSIAGTLLTQFGHRADLTMLLAIGTPEELMIGKPFWAVLHGQIWRLITPIFVHLDIFHILFNMWWLYDLGGLIETRVGKLRFGFLIVTAAIISNAAQYVWAGPGFAGMSGVIYALFGYLWVRGKLDPVFGLLLAPTTAVVLMVWLVLGFTGLFGNVANITHLGGLISGSVIGATAALLARKRR